MSASFFSETSAMAQQQLPGIVAECSEVHTCQASQLAQPLTFWQAIRRAAPEIDVYHWFGRSLVITVLVPCWYRVGLFQFSCVSRFFQ
jgi:hypothetical protein